MRVTSPFYAYLLMDYSHFTVPLYPHPHSQSPGIEHLWVDIGTHPSGRLCLTYRLVGELSKLCVPSLVTNPERQDKLWQHTCFEAFLALEQHPGYKEWNFSPSGEWQQYAFSAYREPVPTKSPPVSPSITCKFEGSNTLCLTAILPAATLEKGKHYSLGLSTVLEDRDGSLSYWALAHPSSQPDFHHRDGFILTLTGTL